MRQPEFLAELLEPTLARHAAVWSEAIAMGFNVAVRCESDELGHIVFKSSGKIEILPKSTSVNWLPASAARELEMGVHRSEQVSDSRRGPGPTPSLFICSNLVPNGLVAVRFDLPPLRALLPGVGTIVTQALAHLKLDRYTDCFDGKTMSALKKILEAKGVVPLLDAVLQVAYLGGVMGEEAQSQAYLDTMTSSEALSELPQDSRTQLDLDSLLDRFMATHDPYDTLKAALAHHAFVRKKVSQAEASRNLRVSRSTLQSHLNMAERLNVARFFSQGQLTS